VIGLTLGFALFCLTVLRWLADKSLPWMQAHLQWPGGVLSLSMGAALLGAAFTEWLGVHAIFGAFLVGVAIGDSPRMRESTRQTLDNFISYIFAPLFFASIGLMVDFRANFDLGLVLVVLLIAFAGKTIGCFCGARLASMGKRESWALGFAMNARGAMEIILGLLALQFGLISERLFVALVVMALVTAIVSGPVMQKILQRRRPTRLADALAAKCFIPRLEAGTREAAIRELSHAAAKAGGLDEDVVFQKAWAREQVGSTGLDGGVAVPHARLPGLARPLVAVGISKDGMDFNSADGSRARLIFLILTPEGDFKSQLELLGDIGRTFRDRDAVGRAVKTPNSTEFVALLRTSTPMGG
jgi:mannitol/fructose-specific phosphotransferase system IIA component (Ntr-type)